MRNRRRISIEPLRRPPGCPRELIRRSALLLLLAGAGCSREFSAHPEPVRSLRRSSSGCQGGNVILVVNDTTRADRVGSYGGPARTPVFDGFARAHVLFEQAWAPAPWTLPAVASLFTSLYPSAHGVVTPALEASRSDQEPPPAIEKVHVLDPSAVTLAEALRSAGYRTAAFVSNPWMDRRLGLDQGFESYDDTFARWDLPGTVISEAALAWLGRRGHAERFFLYLHYLDSHLPYGALERKEVQARAMEIASDTRVPSAQGAAQIADMVRFEDGEPVARAGYRPALRLLEMAYDRGIEDFDRALGVLLRVFESHPAYACTAIIVTSDHGESLYERGWGNHGHTLFEDELHIPMAARLPGVAGPLRFADPVSLVDVMPTLCGYLDVDCPRGLAGIDLAATPGGAEPRAPRYLLAEGVLWQPGLRALRNRRLKLMAGPERPGAPPGQALFDLQRDPRETHNLLSQPSRRASQALAVMGAALAAAVPDAHRLPRKTVPLEADQLDRLRALGYVQ